MSLEKIRTILFDIMALLDDIPQEGTPPGFDVKIERAGMEIDNAYVILDRAIKERGD